jgi:hypothetical protein
MRRPQGDPNSNNVAQAEDDFATLIRIHLVSREQDK